jgi:hypothetical protein
MKDKVPIALSSCTCVVLSLYLGLKYLNKRRKKAILTSASKKEKKNTKMDPNSFTPILRPQKQTMETNFSLDHYRNESKSKRIHKIVFTGGPRAGKT